MSVAVAELFVTVGADVSGAISGLNSLSQNITNIGNRIQSAGRNLTGAITAPIVGAGAAAFAVGTNFEDAFTQVQKTVDNTDFADLKARLIDLSTTEAGGGATAAELAKIAAGAGQLGIQGADNLATFTKVIAGLGVTTSGISLDQLTEDTGRFLTLTHTAITDADKFGSALTALGNDMNGTEGDILALSRRLASVLTALGVSPQDILGISSGLADVGIQAEEGGTAISKFFVEMVAAASTGGEATKEAAQKVQELQDRILDLNGSLEVAVLRQKEFGRSTPASVVKANELAIQKYQREISAAGTKMGETNKASEETTLTLAGLAKVTGMSEDDFAALVKRSPAEAFVEVAHALNRISQEKGPEGVVQALDDLNIKETRLRQTLISLSTAQGKLDQGIEIANREWGKNTALQEEVTKAMQATNAQLKLMTNRLESGLIKDWDEFKTRIKGAIDFMNNTAIPAFGQLGDKWKALGPAQQDFILKTLAIAAALGPALLVIGTLVTVIGALASPLGLVLVLMAVLAAIWIANWGGIRDAVGGAVTAIAGFLRNNLGAALQVAAVAALVAAALIGNAIGGLVVKFAALATTWLLNAAKMAAGWAIAAAPAVGLLLAIAGVIVAVGLLRKAWDSNWLGMQEKVAPILEIIAAIDRAIASFPGFTEGTRKGFQAEADALQAIADKAKQGQAISPASPVLDTGEELLKQFTAGFPAMQEALKAGILAPPTLGVPAPDLTAALTPPAPPIGGLTPGIGQPPVSVTINNPVVFDQAMLDQMNQQSAAIVAQAMIDAESMSSAPAIPTLVPGAI